jgi:hypothetical protein
LQKDRQRDSADRHQQAERRQCSQGSRSQARSASHQGLGRNHLDQAKEQASSDQKKAPAKKKFEGARREKKTG